MPLVSVIIPAYNGDRYIQEAIESVFAQSHSPVEIIVIDDGSTDRTAEVVKAFSQIRYVAQLNQGVAAARNHGFAMAQGEIIAFLDQDDRFLPHKLTGQVEALLQHPEWGMVGSGWQVIDAIGRSISAVQPWATDQTLSLETLIEWKPVLLGAMLFRRAWLERLGGFNVYLQQTSDVEGVLRLGVMGCSLGWLAQPSVEYRLHSGNTSRQVQAQAQELEGMLDQFSARSDLPATVRQVERRSRYQSQVWSAWRLQQQGLLEDMAVILQKSLQNTPFFATETIVQWLNRFAQYSKEYGMAFDSHSLIQSSVWQQLTTLLLQVG